MIKEKKKFVNVTPLSSIARQRFIHTMQSFHACEVVDEDEDLFFLVSLNKMYHFCLQKEGNEHWKIVK